jgi:hypothetical protein
MEACGQEGRGPTWAVAPTGRRRRISRKMHKSYYLFKSDMHICLSLILLGSVTFEINGCLYAGNSRFLIAKQLL